MSEERPRGIAMPVSDFENIVKSEFRFLQNPRKKAAKEGVPEGLGRAESWHENCSFFSGFERTGRLGRTEGAIAMISGNPVAKDADPAKRWIKVHPAWITFIRYCEALGFGEIGKLRIQDGLPLAVEKIKIDAVSIPASGEN